MPTRLGDDIDDFCIKCKRLTNHSVVSILEEKPAKVRCRTCYHDHDFRNEEPLPSKKELKKAADLAAAAAGLGPVDGDEPDEDDPVDELEPDAAGDEESDEPAPAKQVAAKKAPAAKKAAKKAGK